jgi:hypothetical protein
LFDIELVVANATMFPGFIHKCPYTIFKVYNATMSLTAEENDALNAPKHQLLPNGVFKNRLGFYDDLDDNIGEITYFFELYSYLKNGEFK